MNWANSDGTYRVNVTSSDGFTWNGTWYQVKPSHGDDDGPPAGVREPRRPHPSGGPSAVAVEV